MAESPEPANIKPCKNGLWRVIPGGPCETLEEAIERNIANQYMRRKRLIPTKRWTDMLDAAHAHAFTVSGLMNIDMLTIAKEAVDAAINQKLTKEDFREFFRARMKNNGFNWEKGTDGRLNTIFKTNVQSAIGAGNWVSAQDNITEKPYGIYRLGNSKEHRPLHVREANRFRAVPLENKTFWGKIWPPNGYNCACWVETISAEDARKQGVKVHNKPKLPKGVIERGFNFNQGEEFLKSLERPDAPKNIAAAHNANLQKLRNIFDKIM